MNIRKEGKTTYTVIPAHYLEEMEKVFKNQGIEYEVLYGKDIPDEVPQAFFYEGKVLMFGLCCIKSEMNSDDINALVLSKLNPYKYGLIEDKKP